MVQIDIFLQQQQQQSLFVLQKLYKVDKYKEEKKLQRKGVSHLEIAKLPELSGCDSYTYSYEVLSVLAVF